MKVNFIFKINFLRKYGFSKFPISMNFVIFIPVLPKLVRLEVMVENVPVAAVFHTAQWPYDFR